MFGQNIKLSFLVSAAIVLLSGHAYANTDSDRFMEAVIADGLKKAGHSQDDDPDQQIQWNEKSDSPSQELFSETEQHYDARLATIQENLKILGFYNSTVDGITGRQTLDAIYRWESEYDQEINGEISDEEFQKLETDALSAENNTNTEVISSSENTIKIDPIPSSAAEDSYAELIEDFSTLHGYEMLRKVCISFTNTGNAYASAIHFDFQQKSALFNKSIEEMFIQKAECIGLSSEQIQNLKNKGQEKYESTQEYSILKMVVPMAISDDQTAMNVVKSCNLYIESIPLIEEKLKEPTPNQNICKIKDKGE